MKYHRFDQTQNIFLGNAKNPTYSVLDYLYLSVDVARFLAKWTEKNLVTNVFVSTKQRQIALMELQTIQIVLVIYQEKDQKAIYKFPACLKRLMYIQITKVCCVIAKPEKDIYLLSNFVCNKQTSAKSVCVLCAR